MAELYATFQVTAVDKNGRKVSLLLTRDKLLPGNAYSKKDAEEVAMELRALLNDMNEK